MNTSNRRSAAFRAAVSILVLASALLVAGCAGMSARGEVPQAADPALMQEALRLTQSAGPEELRRAVEMLRQAAEYAPEAGELAGLAVSLFRILYPELVENGYLDTASIPPYSGSYRAILDRAAAGEPPLTDADPSSVEFFDWVLPALFLARLEPGAGEPPVLGGHAAALQQARGSAVESVLPPYLLAQIRELRGDPGRAEALYREALDRSPSFYPAARSLALNLLRQGRSGEAAAVLRPSATRLPGEVSILSPLAEAYFQDGQLERAAQSVAQVLLEEPDREEALLLRARILVAEGKWSQALRMLNLMLYKHPDSREAYLLTARVMFEQAADPEGALELALEGEAQFPDAVEFPELAGRIFLDTDRSGEGLNKLQRALDLEPGRLSTLRLLLANATSMRRWLQAGIYLSQILEQEQSEQDLLQAIEIYSGLGDRAQVLFYAEQLYAADPSAENLVTYAEALLNDGQREQAAALVERGLEQARNPAQHSTLLTLKASLVEEEDPDRAFSLIREALIEDPENYRALVRIAELYVQRRELRKASLYLKQALALDPDNAALEVQLNSIQRSLDEAANP